MPSCRIIVHVVGSRTGTSSAGLVAASGCSMLWSVVLLCTDTCEERQCFREERHWFGHENLPFPSGLTDIRRPPLLALGMWILPGWPVGEISGPVARTARWPSLVVLDIKPIDLSWLLPDASSSSSFGSGGGPRARGSEAGSPPIDGEGGCEPSKWL